MDHLLSIVYPLPVRSSLLHRSSSLTTTALRASTAPLDWTKHNCCENKAQAHTQSNANRGWLHRCRVTGHQPCSEKSASNQTQWPSTAETGIPCRGRLEESGPHPTARLLYTGLTSRGTNLSARGKHGNWRPLPHARPSIALHGHSPLPRNRVPCPERRTMSHEISCGISWVLSKEELR